MVSGAGPEVTWVIAEFEAGMTSGKDSISKHHDQSASVQKDSQALASVFQEMENFLD